MLIRLIELVGSPDDDDFESATFVQNIRITGCLGTTSLYEWDSLTIKHVDFKGEQRLPSRTTIKMSQKNTLRRILNTNFLCIPVYKINSTCTIYNLYGLTLEQLSMLRLPQGVFRHIMRSQYLNMLICLCFIFFRDHIINLCT